MFETILSYTWIFVATTTTGRVLVEERDRAVLHLPRGVGLGRDVRDLLQLERAFERNGQADVASEVQKERLLVVALGDVLDRVIAVEELRDLVGQVVHRVEDEAVVLGRERAADLRELERDEDQQRHLRGERLRGGHADLEPAARVEHGVDLARDLRAHLVRDRDRRGAGRLREAHGRDRVARLARLRDADHEACPSRAPGCGRSTPTRCPARPAGAPTPR
jgi:hypothetical protein